MNLTKTQVLQKGKQFLLHMWHLSCYSCIILQYNIPPLKRPFPPKTTHLIRSDFKHTEIVKYYLIGPHLKICVSPRPTDSLKNLQTQKILFEFPIKVFFYFRNFESVSVIVISVSAFYYNRKLLLIRLQEWKFFFFTYLPTLFLKGGSAEGKHTYCLMWPCLSKERSPLI